MKARSSKKQSSATGLNHHLASSSATTTPLSPFQLRAQQSTQVQHAAQLQAMSTSQPPAQLQAQQHASTQNQQAVQLQHTSPESQEQEHAPTQLQSKTSTAATADAPPKPNNTGLPDKLKAGIENLSGYSMDDVKVHRNSSKPAQLNAYAYAQGTDIHLGPGQEKHLPHEAWHVVQQKQGRVKATTQMKGVGVNDDVGLEREATQNGQRAAGKTNPSPLKHTKHSGVRHATKQLAVDIKAKNYKKLDFTSINIDHEDYYDKLKATKDDYGVRKVVVRSAAMNEKYAGGTGVKAKEIWTDVLHYKSKVKFADFSKKNSIRTELLAQGERIRDELIDIYINIEANKHTEKHEKIFKEVDKQGKEHERYITSLEEAKTSKYYSHIIYKLDNLKTVMKYYNKLYQDDKTQRGWKQTQKLMAMERTALGKTKKSYVETFSPIDGKSLKENGHSLELRSPLWQNGKQELESTGHLSWQPPSEPERGHILAKQNGGKGTHPNVFAQDAGQNGSSYRGTFENPMHKLLELHNDDQKVYFQAELMGKAIHKESITRSSTPAWTYARMSSIENSAFEKTY